VLESIAIALASALGGYLLDRVKYARQLTKLAAGRLDGNARMVAEQAVITANQREIERTTEKLLRMRAEHEVREAAIRASDGQVNIGHLSRPKERDGL
jgi:hypothetical protein